MTPSHKGVRDAAGRAAAAAFGGWSLTGPKIYRINVFVRDREAIELRVATRDSVAVDRAIAAITTRLPSPRAAE